MNPCVQYEMIISALLDDEASRDEMLELLAHLPGCASCQQFYGACRALQEATAGSRVSGSGERVVALRPQRPRFPVVLSLAAGIVLALGFALGRFGRPEGGATRTGGEGTAVATAPMTEESFVAYARALLKAEPRFQIAMREILANAQAENTEGSHEGELTSEEGWSAEDWTGQPGAQTLDFVSPVASFAVLPQ